MGMDIKAVIAMVILVVVAFVLFPLVQDSIGPMVIDNYSGDGEGATASGATKTLIEQVPLFYVLAIVLSIIGVALASTRSLSG